MFSSRFVAPYWADVDTRGTGAIYHRQTTDPSLLARATSEIRGAFPGYLYEITNLFIATWDKVGYYLLGTDKVRNIMLFRAFVLCRVLLSFHDTYVYYISFCDN